MSLTMCYHVSEISFTTTHKNALEPCKDVLTVPVLHDLEYVPARNETWFKVLCTVSHCHIILRPLKRPTAEFTASSTSGGKQLRHGRVWVGGRRDKHPLEASQQLLSGGKDNSPGRVSHPDNIEILRCIANQS